MHQLTKRALLYQTVPEHNAYNVHFALISQANTMLKIFQDRQDRNKQTLSILPNSYNKQFLLHGRLGTERLERLDNLLGLLLRNGLLQDLGSGLNKLLAVNQ